VASPDRHRVVAHHSDPRKLRARLLTPRVVLEDKEVLLGEKQHTRLRVPRVVLGRGAVEIHVCGARVVPPVRQLATLTPFVDGSALSEGE